MKTKIWNILIYLHGALLLWFVLFVTSLFIPDGGKTASVLAIGNALFLFANIPLGIFSLVLNKKNHFDQHKALVIVLSVINMIVGIIMWLFVVMFMQMP